MSITGWYVTAALGLAAIATAGIVTLELCRPDIDRGLLITVFGWLAPTLAAILALLRGAANGQQLVEVQQKAEEAAVKADVAKQAATATRADLKTNTVLTAQIGDAVQQLGAKVEQINCK